MHRPCDFCTYQISLESRFCPHCGRPQLFPNVERARIDSERAALNNRYQSALSQSEKQSTIDTMRTFESRLKTTQAVMTCRLKDAETLISSDSELFSTYYQLINVTFLPKGGEWDDWRQTAEVKLFGVKNVGEIRFAALSADGNGLTNYKDGECFIHLREDMIGHRATVFEENNVLLFRKFLKHLDRGYPPPGHMASWEDRHKLCIAKLHGKIQNGAGNAEFAAILLKNGQSTADDDFVEVHIFGPMTRRTFSKIVVAKPKTRTRTALKMLRDQAEAASLELEIKP
jgi:hypothetical protein